MMKKLTSIILSALAISTVSAQSLTEAVRLGTTDIGGTARYRAMGGAFGALGGDLSCMGDNPAGMAIYRGTSEFALTPHLTMSNSTTSFNGANSTEANKTQFALSNLGVVFSFMSEDWDNLINFNLGLGFQRKADVFRRYKSNIAPSTRFDEYICGLYNASYSAGLDEKDMDPLPWLGNPKRAWTYDYNPYASGNADYVVPAIDPSLGASQSLDVTEKTRMDEYQISGSFNFGDTFYAGMTIGVIDLNSHIESNLDERYHTPDNTYLNYENWEESRGTGFNMKFGVMYRPIDELRLGLAVHTPTWYNVKETYGGRMYTESNYKQPSYEYGEPWEYTLRTPWEVQASAATVLAKRLILSAEFDWRFTNTMRYSQSRDYLLSGGDSFFNLSNNTIEDYTRTQVTMKFGAEFRLTKALSLRAGYANITSPYKNEALNGTANSQDPIRYAETQYDLYYNGTKVDYNTLGAQQYVSAGLGYRNGSWGIDLTYVLRTREGKMAANPANLVDVKSDILDLKTKTSAVDLTISYKFGK